MNKVMILCSLVSGVAFAGGSDATCETPKLEIPKPRCSVSTKPVVKTVTKRHTPSVATPSQSQTQTAQSSSVATGTAVNNVQITIMHPKAPEPKYTLDLRTAKVVAYKPNRLFLLGGFSKTVPYAITDDCGCSAVAKTKREFDWGGGYLRDFGHATVGIIGTWNGGVYLAAGFNW